MAEWLRSGLQSRLHRFDSGRRLSSLALNRRCFLQASTITLEAVPTTTTPIERLAACWREQSVLAPGQAANAAGELRAELTRIEPTLRASPMSC